MNNRLFRKLFITTAVSLIVSIVLILILVSVSVNSYFVNDKKQLLTDNCLSISAVLSGRTESEVAFYNGLDAMTSVVSKAVLGAVYVSDAEGNGT